MIQAMVLSSFLVACVAFTATVIHLRRGQGNDDLDGVGAMTPSPFPTLPAATAESPAPFLPSPSLTPSPAFAEPLLTELPAAVEAAPVAQPAARPAARSGKNNGFARFNAPARQAQRTSR